MHEQRITATYTCHYKNKCIINSGKAFTCFSSVLLQVIMLARFQGS